MKRRVGVLLSGGVAAGMNALLEELVNLLDRKDTEIVAFLHGWSGLVNNEHILLTPSSIEYISNIGGGAIGSCTKVNVFDYQGRDCSKDCEKNYNELKLDTIFVLGGDGSLRQADELSEKTKMRFITLPCTMDRDVIGTKESIGFYTAVKEAKRSIVINTNDADCMNRISISEVMGRGSGAVAAYATYAAIEEVHVDILLIPEKPYSKKKLIDYINNAKNPLSIVIAEGIGNQASQSMNGIHVQLAGVAEQLAEELKQNTGKNFKANVCGYGQRSANASDADKLLAKLFAQKAATVFLKKQKNVAICYNNNSFYALDLAHIATLNRTTTGKGINVTTDPIIDMLTRQNVYFGN